MMGAEKIAKTINNIENKFKDFFNKKVETKKQRYRHEHRRNMDEHQIKEYQFKLFVIYSFIFTSVCLFFIYVISEVFNIG